MAFEFHLPDIGEGVVEGEIVGWKVKEGDMVALDQPLVEVMTDKATVEIPSPRAGTLSQINYREGQVCPVGEVLFVIDEAGEGASAPSASARPRSASATRRLPRLHRPRPAANGNGQRSRARATWRPRPRARRRRRMRRRSSTRGPARRVLATPATRRLARQLGVELRGVPATGQRGRVTSDDVAPHGRGRRRGRPAARDRAVARRSRRSRSRRAARRSGSRSAACASASPRTWPARCPPRRTSPTSRRWT